MSYVISLCLMDRQTDRLMISTLWVISKSPRWLDTRLCPQTKLCEWLKWLISDKLTWTSDQPGFLHWKTFFKISKWIHYLYIALALQIGANYTFYSMQTRIANLCNQSSTYTLYVHASTETNPIMLVRTDNTIYIDL